MKQQKASTVFKVLYIDEIAHKKGRGKFMIVIYSEAGILATAIGRSSKSLQEALKKIPNVSDVEKVCIDMCAPFADAIREVIPSAEIILDRFHLIKNINEALWALNKKTYRKLDKTKRNRYKNIRYLLSLDYKTLDRYEKRLVREYLRLNIKIKEAYWLVQDYRKILFNFRGKKDSFISQMLTEWHGKIAKIFSKLYKTMNTWWTEIINACKETFSNGVLEGTNNKIKLVKRRAYGYRNWLNFHYRITAACNP